MAAKIDEFDKNCIEILEIHFGKLAGRILNKVKTKKSLDERSNIKDINEFIGLIEINISVLAGKNKANEIGSILRNKALDIVNKKKKCEPAINSDMASEIDAFLKTNILPNESDVTDYIKHLSLKYGSKSNKIDKETKENINIYIKETINRNKIREEINEFLTRYPKPLKNDIDDFINYIRLSKLVFHEDELRDEIEKERLYRKFHGPQDEVKKYEINELVNLLKNTNDNVAFKKNLQNQELSYLIRDESGVSGNSLSDFVQTMTPTQEETRDTLEGLGLTHLISDKRRKG